MRSKIWTKTICNLVILLCFGLSLLNAPEGFADQKGTKLMEQAYNHPSRSGSLGRLKMILTDKAGGERTRVFFNFSKRQKKRFLSIIRFVQPNNVKNTALLTADRKGGSGDQWLYMPALGKSRRISASRKGGRFVGSDVFFEDLRDREVNLDKHHFLREESIGGAKVAVIESVPRKPSNSFYSKRIVWLHQELKIPLKIEFFKGKRGKPVKRHEAKKLEQIEGVWTVTHSIMADLQNRSTTALIVEKLHYDNKIPRSFFSVRSLEEPSQDEKLRSRLN